LQEESALASHNDADYALWPGPVCLLVAGMPAKQKETVIAHFSRTAQTAGIALGGDNCSPHLFVYVTADTDNVLAQLRHNDFFNTSKGMAPVNRFLGSTRPIRVWYNDYTASNVIGSRVIRDYVRMIGNAVIVVVKRTGSVTVGQVADYIALIGLAEINLDADLGEAPTILRLFAAKADAPSYGLTSWDKALLKSLYRVPAKNATRLSEMQTEQFNLLKKAHSKRGRCGMVFCPALFCLSSWVLTDRPKPDYARCWLVGELSRMRVSPSGSPSFRAGVSKMYQVHASHSG
jgi:hypothetical protein